MRKLQTHDIFAFGRVIKEIGIKEEVKCICMKANTIGDLYESGFELIFGIFEKCTSEEAENALIKFFADILEEEPQAVKECDPVEFMDKIFEVAEPEKVEGFFYAGSFFDSVELKELLLRRYHSLSFINDMDITEFAEFVKLAKEKDREDRLFQQWCAMLPQMTEYKAFEDFRDILTGANLDLRPASVIIAEIEALHKQKGE